MSKQAYCCSFIIICKYRHKMKILHYNIPQSMNSMHSENFSRLNKTEIDKTYEILKQFTKRVETRSALETSIRNIVQATTLLSNYIGIPIRDMSPDMSKIKVCELRDIHRSMREALKNARNRQQKLERIVSIVKVVDYFLQY